MEKSDIAIVGLGPMGTNLSLNIESKGYKVSIYDIVKENITKFIRERAADKAIFPANNLEELISSLKKPKKILVMIPAGKSVDEIIKKLVPLLKKDDLIIDGGNSFFKDTIRRNDKLSKKGILFLGVGISGGGEGALNGPAIMPGGQPEAYKLIKDIFEDISAKADDGIPCVSYIGKNGAGHYVKMVHNGIEYADMQLIGECVWTLKKVLNLNPKEIAAIIKSWNKDQDILSSYLIEITSKILMEKNKKTEEYLIDKVADITRMKGTGTWTVQSALELLVPVPTIAAAVFSREMSQYKERRLKIYDFIQFGKINKINKINKLAYNRSPYDFINNAHDALYIAKISSYAQGFDLLKTASDHYKFGLNLSEIAKGWRAGCIIRARLLDDIVIAFKNDPKLINLITIQKFKDFITDNIYKLASFIETAHNLGLPLPAMNSAYDYILQLESPIIISSQVTALQRDYFGAHGYFKLENNGLDIIKKSDRKLKEYHTEWMIPGHAEIEK
ncbi:MAG: NADP-dependent phosphogluconate dehydrogenase [Actinobacteria bacterium]|nr:NADP-dependent phosphogluconate dehydrogenase [Actinomycetota bacterium]